MREQARDRGNAASKVHLRFRGNRNGTSGVRDHLVLIVLQRVAMDVSNVGAEQLCVVELSYRIRVAPVRADMDCDWQAETPRRFEVVHPDFLWRIVWTAHG